MVQGLHARIFLPIDEVYLRGGRHELLAVYRRRQDELGRGRDGGKDEEREGEGTHASGSM